jgi:DNA repair protein RadA/Sms
MEGGRPLLVEVQALTVNVPGEAPARRSVQGLDAGRLPMLLAVLDTRLTLDPRLGRRDVYTSVVGGIRVGEPAADLGVVLALLSACQNRAVDAGTVAFGEVGLGGEIRQVAHTPRRLAEAARLGFTRAVVPRSTTDAPPGIELVRMATVAEAAGIVLRAAPVRPRVLTVVKP